jgi:hypothetical protein
MGVKFVEVLPLRMELLLELSKARNGIGQSNERQNERHLTKTHLSISLWRMNRFSSAASRCVKASLVS